MLIFNMSDFNHPQNIDQIVAYIMKITFVCGFPKRFRQWSTSLLLKADKRIKVTTIKTKRWEESES